ncbi:MAG: hemolysin III family protein [Pseudomonadales bacterium]
MADFIKRLQLMFPYRDQTVGEEIANTFSHGLGLGIAVFGSVYMIQYSIQHSSAKFIVGTCIFSATMIFLYLASALYHGLPKGKAKRIFQNIDHSAIFLLIAGTYTPFTLGVLNGVWGWTIFGVIWTLAAIGITLKVIYKTSHAILFTCLYLLMGWVIVLAIDLLLDRVPTAGLLWLLAGGLSYTLGVVFFATDSQLKYGHSVWHLFVIVGTGCHYFAILWYGA